MILVSYNHKYALISNENQTYFVEVPSFQTKGTLEMKTTIGDLQYASGIAALVIQSKIRLYDFLYKKDLYDYETHLKVVKIGLYKNMLIIISTQRILIHDLRNKVNQCYIPIQQGQLAFLSRDYYSLRFAYYTESHLLVNRQLWLNKNQKIQGVSFTYGAYSNNGTFVGLALKNLFSIYEDNNLVRLYGFDLDIIELVYAGAYFFVKLQNGEIFGCNKQNRVNFLQHEQIECELWAGEQAILMGGDDSIYDVGKGIIKRYRMARAQLCDLGDTKLISSKKRQISIS